MSPSLPVILAGGEPSYTPSQYMPSFLVEIAFDSNYATPAADRTWTDVTDYVELRDLIGIGVGRQDERSTADANDLTLTLDNSDGRFTALRSASPYYPNVKVGRPIRVSATTVTGVASIRFVGFIDGWPVEWDGTDAYAKATIRATSRMARLGLTAQLRSFIEQEILAAGPFAYYTLGDPSGSTTASESSGSGAQIAPMTPMVVDSAISPGVATFGNAIGVASDGLTAMTYPVDGGPYEVSLPGVTVQSLRMCFLSDPDTFGDFLAEVQRPSGTSMTLLHYGSLDTPTYGVAGGVFGSGLEGGYAPPGVLHDVVVTSSVADGAKLYLDGFLVDTGAGTDFTDMTLLRIGQQNNTRAFTFCHVALYDTILTPTQIATQATAATSGHAGETTDERLLRILGWLGVASTEVDAEAGSETMTYQQTGGQGGMDALRECESTEGGVLFDGPDGNVKFHNRSHRYQAEPAVTLDMESQHVGADYAPRLDRSTLVNDVTVNNPSTGQSARATDTASSDEYGLATASPTSLADSYEALVQKAAWITNSYREPRMRCPSLTVDVLAHVGLTPSAEDLLAVTVGDALAVTNAPAQSDTTSPTYFVEGYTETIGPESYSITFNLSPTYPTLNTLILDHATRAELDAGNVVAY